MEKAMRTLFIANQGKYVIHTITECKNMQTFVVIM